MGWTKFKNTVRCCNCKAYYFPEVSRVVSGKLVFRCPRCQCEDWTYTKEKEQCHQKKLIKK